MAIDSVKIFSLITRFVGSSSQTLTGSRLLHPQRLVLWSGEGITVIIIVTSKCQHHENGIVQNTLQNRRYILDSRSMILADSFNCMEWWVKVSVRPCTNRDNIQFQLHQTMSVTRPEPMACIISLILVQFLVWLHPIQSVGNNRSSHNNSKCNF